MKILFLHPNFPAQFKHLSRMFADQGNEVNFLCQTNYGKEIEGVKVLKLKGEASHEKLNSKKLNLVERTKFLSEQYRLGFTTLRKNNWEPDVVISHSGWGCGLYVKEVWPNCKFISYLEWWFNPKSDFFYYDENNKELGLNRNSIKKNWDRNKFIALELASSDQIVAPTKWQGEQLPNILRKNCEIIFDGIDLDFYRINLLSRNSTPLLTYGTRGMDPFRGFPQFIKSLPKIFSTNKHLKVEIAGNSTVFYGSHPEGFDNWKTWAIDYLKKHKIDDQVAWKGFMKSKDYLRWLQSSWCHVYLTHPFVASWSMVESLACGSHLIASNVEATREFCDDMEGVSLVDHRDIEQIVHCVNNAFSCCSKISFYDRSAVLQRLSKEHSLQCWAEIIEKVHTNY